MAWLASVALMGQARSGHDQTTITVVVEQPEVEHKVRMRDFEAQLEIRRWLTG